MKKTNKIPESELEIMLVIWEANQSVTSDYIMERIHKDWAKPTLLNLLTRLCDRKFLKCKKEGKRNIYTPIIQKEDYVKAETKSFLKRMYHNSIKNLVATLYCDESISKKDLQELKKFIEEAK